mmetsp:Transcript_44278/g.95021  ORF Transcript_44278/g.95021 Transcript_44278/m.95021 type:complete len:212 (+) Transcript_44278:860-1495(+)
MELLHLQHSRICGIELRVQLRELRIQSLHFCSDSLKSCLCLGDGSVQVLHVPFVLLLLVLAPLFLLDVLLFFFSQDLGHFLNHGNDLVKMATCFHRHGNLCQIEIFGALGQTRELVVHDASLHCPLRLLLLSSCGSCCWSTGQLQLQEGRGRGSGRGGALESLLSVVAGKDFDGLRDALELFSSELRSLSPLVRPEAASFLGLREESLVGS